jgi:hypothetical protein
VDILNTEAGHQWIRPVILATQEAEKTLSQKYPTQKKVHGSSGKRICLANMRP